MKCLSEKKIIFSNIFEINKKIKRSENNLANKVLEPIDKHEENENLKYSTEIKNNNDISDYKTNFIIIRYKTNPKSLYLKIFGNDFVKNNKNNCKIMHKNKIYKLMEYFKFNESYHNDIFEIKLLGINNINDISYMFSNCTTLVSLSRYIKIKYY